MTLRKLIRSLTRAQKYARDVNALASGNPARIERRIKNRLVGRALARVGFWRWLWKSTARAEADIIRGDVRPLQRVPAPLAARIPAPALVVLLIGAVPLALAIFVFRWPWWAAVLAPIVVFAIFGFIGNRYDAYQTAAWIRRHPEVMAKKPER